MFLGIEIGGTKLQLGLGHGDGRLIRHWRAAVEPSAGGAGIRRQILAATSQLLNQEVAAQVRLRGIGVGFGGPVNDSTHATIRSHQIDGWEDFPIGAWLNESFAAPVALGNDADVAGLAEALFGAGRDLSPIFYITIGSGIGGGLIIDQRIYRGCGQGAAEIGHLRTLDSSAKCLPLEEIASGWAIEERFRKATHLSLKVPEIVVVANQSDEAAKLVFLQALQALAEAICHVIALLCPRRIIVGGGVSLLGDALFVPLRQLVADRVFKPFAGLTEIVPAALGEEVVVHGALALARQRSELSRNSST